MKGTSYTPVLIRGIRGGGRGNKGRGRGRGEKYLFRRGAR